MIVKGNGKNCFNTDSRILFSCKFEFSHLNLICKGGGGMNSEMN